MTMAYASLPYTIIELLEGKFEVNNMFSFQQAMNTSTIFVIFGMGEAYIRAYMRKSVRFPE